MSFTGDVAEGAEGRGGGGAAGPGAGGASVSVKMCEDDRQLISILLLDVQGELGGQGFIFVGLFKVVIIALLYPKRMDHANRWRTGG